jgi:hypothetical protein
MPEEFKEAFKVKWGDCPIPENAHGFAEFSAMVSMFNQEDGSESAIVAVKHTEPEQPFVFWMCLTEYLMGQVARRSNAGFEAALESLVKGAMTYKEAGDHPPRQGEE